jgi:thymidylate synthase
MIHNHMDRAWIMAINEVHLFGDRVVPRGKPTLELLNHTIAVDMRYPVLSVPERKLGYKFMAAEAAWILSGDNRVETIKQYSKTISDFSDDGITFFGAYGTKIISEQFIYAKDVLKKDHNTRQAVINIWRESPKESKDIPCTLSCQFMIRQCMLDLFVTMRSSDIWLGVPYDIFNFSMLGVMMLLALNDPRLQLGTIYNTAASRHLYESDIPAAIPILRGNFTFGNDYNPCNWHEFQHKDNLISHLWNIANGKATFFKWLGDL